MESFNQNVIKHKTGLLNLAAELGNISKACKIMGFSRDTFYRYQSARDEGGVEALFEVSRRKPNLKNRVEEATELAISAARTLFTSAQSRVSVAFINRPMWTHTPSGQRPNSTPPRRPSPEPTCSMIEFCLSSFHRKWALSAF